jgi:hypothetical protein
MPIYSQACASVKIQYDTKILLMYLDISLSVALYQTQTQKFRMLIPSIYISGLYELLLQNEYASHGNGKLNCYKNLQAGNIKYMANK